ncbi:MAG: hypothetical protein LBB34_01980 [Holosporales bacterium]|jgi:hypothetical protein|nr:hypothetical protein [Holosporales bacterium]
MENKRFAIRYKITTVKRLAVAIIDCLIVKLPFENAVWKNVFDIDIAECCIANNRFSNRLCYCKVAQWEIPVEDKS